MSDDIVLQEWFRKIDADLAFVIQCFKEVLIELGQDALAARLPWANGPLSADEGPGAQSVERELQALSVAFHLLNLVEENAAAQARRARETQQGLLHEPGTWGQNLRQLRELGVPDADIASALRKVHVEVVLTAHPTEAKRPIVLRQHRELLQALEERESSVWTPRERDEIRRRIKLILERLWRTGEMYLHKPDISQELNHILDFFGAIFPEVLPLLDRKLREAWDEAGLDAALLKTPGDFPRLTFGNWVGGDRDGHPLVTADVTRDTLARLRATAVGIAEAQLRQLYDTLSISELFQNAPKALLSAVESKAKALRDKADEVLQRTRQEPWRRFVGLMILCLPDGDARPCTYRSEEELARDIELLAEALRAVGADRIVEAEIVPIQRSLDAFGFHMAALDIRQNSKYHEQAMQELMAAAGLDADAYATMEENARQAFLRRELETARPLAPRGVALGEKAQAVIDCYQAVADHIKKHGSRGIGSFIVSMTRDLSDLLTVYVLAREVGLVHPSDNGLVCDVPVVPLFETIDDLKRSPQILTQFLEHPITRRSIHARGDEALQQVMVGYSDSNKGSGTFASFWNLHRAELALSGVGRARGVNVFFFHGRGGTPSRGAGPTHRFLESLPHRSLRGHFRLTEQGETIAQKYGNLETAEYNLELLLAGVAATTIKHAQVHEEDPAFQQYGERLSLTSRQAYQTLLDTDGFLEFWAQATPIDALEQSFIGSRPARRTGRRSLEDLRAIPWVFSWSQARYYLTGWYGVGTALERLKETDPKGFEHLKANIHTWRFMRYVIYNAETTHSSADADLMRAYAGLVDDEAVRGRILGVILEEYARTERMINEIFGAPRAERRPRMVKTVGMRSEGLRILHHRQIALLREWRRLLRENRNEEADEMLPALLLSINAIASGQRTTG